MRAVVVAAVAGLVFLLGVAERARASLIVLDDGRYVSVDGLGPIRPAPGESLFLAHPVGAYGEAFQASSGAADGISADGSTSLVGGSVQAQSVLSLRFTVDTAQAFTLAGSISGGPGASAFLADSDGIFHVLGPDLGLTGVFAPGTEYTLFVGLMDDAGSFHVELAVPEPPLALLLLGLVPLLWGRG
jgi:hypothetical protein